MRWIHRAELQEVLDILDVANRKGFYWLHLSGAPGTGKSQLLHQLADLVGDQGVKILFVDGSVLPPSLFPFYRIALKGLFALFPVEMRRFVQSLPSGLGVRLQRLRRGQFRAGERYRPFLEQIVAAALLFLARHHRLLLILDHLDAAPETGQVLKPFLALVRSLPMVVISAGGEAGADGFSPHRRLILNALNQRQTELLVQERLGCSDMAARLITNKIFLKSRGNPRLLLAMLSAYFSMFERATALDASHIARLQQINVQAHEGSVLHGLMQQLAPPERTILSLLAALEQPVAFSAVRRLAQVQGMGQDCLQTWKDRGWLEWARLFHLTLVHIRWPAWRTLLRQAFQQETPTELFPYLLDIQNDQPIEWPVQVSHLFFRAGQTETAVELALGEAERFWQNDCARQALERLQFVSRHFHRLNTPPISRNQLLHRLADCYQHLGLNANALDALQQLREHLAGGSASDWAQVHARMAQLLLSMDELAEARFFLQELKGRKRLPAVQRARLACLQGDLEYNLGHPTYALRYWLKAVETLPVASRHTLARDLFQRLQHFAARQEVPVDEQMRWLALFARRKLVRENLNFQRTLWEVRLLFQSKAYLKALSLLDGLVRQPKLLEWPGELLAAHLLRAEVLGTVGRWEQAAKCLSALEAGVFPFLTPSQRLNVLLKLAIVSKERGQLGEALHWLGRAEQLAREWEAPPKLRMEIELHQGHVHLLVHNYLSAGDRLKQVYAEARRHGYADLLLSAGLWLAWYALLQNRYSRAEKFLDEACNLDMAKGSVEWFNLLFYQIQYHLARKATREAAVLLEAWFREVSGEHKFQILGLWMRGQLALLEGRGTTAARDFQRAHRLATSSGSRYVAYQIAKSLCRSPASTEQVARQRLAMLKRDFQNLLEAIEDPLLQRQFAESREKQELAALAQLWEVGPAAG